MIKARITGKDGERFPDEEAEIALAIERTNSALTLYSADIDRVLNEIAESVL